jgi:hypothetical protein
MKIVILHLENASAVSLFSDEKMETVQYLLGLGCYGIFTGHGGEHPPRWMVLVDPTQQSQDAPTLTIQDFLLQAGKGFISSTSQSYADFRDILNTQESDCYYFLDQNFNQAADLPAYLPQFNQELGGLLGSLSDDTVLLIVAAYADQNGFILVAPNLPLAGEQQGVAAENLAATVLEAAGYPLPDGLKANSLLAGMSLGDQSASGLTEEEEAILRERLSGLGYI